jgi:hypothetical protein
VALLDRYRYDGVFYGHWGQGCVHCRIDWQLRTAEGVATYRRFMEEAADLVVAHGGSLSGEHGDGHGRAELWPKMFSPELMRAFTEFKHIWDPDNRMNPHKLIDPYPLDSHIHQGTTHRPLALTTRFGYPEDGGNFADAVGRCYGVGKCRHLDGGVMCPSFMVTREEKHSTRGRARLLQEMAESSGPIKGRWRSAEVKDALDLCLACKGCKGDCPIKVDMATYKAEFLSHYYAGRLRPRQAYALGLIPVWARLAAHAPRLANTLTQAPGTRHQPAGQARRRRRAATPPAAVRQPDVQALVRRPHPPLPGRTAGAAVAGHLRQLLRATCRHRRGGGAGSRRVPRHAARSLGVLRAPAVRLRAARDRPPLPDPHAGAAAPADRSRCPGDRPGTQLPGGVPRRAGQHAAA